MKPYYITTAIDYVNAPPHVGHALEKVQADVAARFARLQGRETFYLTGTDEQSLKNVRAAREANEEVAAFVARNSESFKALQKALNLSLDGFIQTTEERHVAGAQKFWELFSPADIYKKDYRGLYCVGCEEFKLEKDLIDGQCPDHKREPEVVEEENYFFRLSSYANRIEELITSGQLVIEPEFRKNEMLSFIRSGLEDISISRSVKRAENWGVPVPGDQAQVMYVWVDALSNYITALDFITNGDNYQKFWSNPNSERIHLVGKGILRFHAIYWPAFLLSAGLSLPTKIMVHEYLTVDNTKISKSLGNVITPDDVIAKFGQEATRYLLLSSLPTGRDGDITWDKLEARYAADLVNGLGNLLARTIALRTKFALNELSMASGTPDRVAELTQSFHFAEALIEIWGLVTRLNQRLEQEAPWAEADEVKRTATLREVSSGLMTLAEALTAYLPETATAIKAQLRGEAPAHPLFPRLTIIK